MSLKTITDFIAQYPLYADILKMSGVLVLSFVLFFITKRYLLKGVASLVLKSKIQIDDILLKNKVFHRLSYLIPVILVYCFANIFKGFEVTVRRLSTAFSVWVIVLVLNSLLSALTDILKESKVKDYTGMKSYIQIANIVIFLVGFIVIIAVLIGQSPVILLSGIGAMTAVLLFIFRDTILSFIASLQISSYDLVNVGDWIEVPKYGADGDVIDIALHTIKVQNWDKTITIIPTHKLIEESFKNWRGMTESGGRRIKRAIFIDVNSIRLCDAEMLERFKKFQLITDYIMSKETEIAAYNTAEKIDTSELINGRRLTNVGVFRAYVKAYLQNHPKIHNDLTFLIRQLAPGSNGLPIEIYVFTNDIKWANYEDIQSDVFDHILATISRFDLKVFQSPSGADFQKLAGWNSNQNNSSDD